MSVHRTRHTPQAAETPTPPRGMIHLHFTLDERDAIDQAKARVRGLLTAALALHDQEDKDMNDQSMGHLLEIADEYMLTINESFAAADARRKDGAS